MSTHVSVNTYTYSVTHVTGEMVRSLKDIIRSSGLSVEKLLDDWSSVEYAIHTLIGSRHLKRVTLEVYNPASNKLVVRWDIDVDYSYSAGDDGSLWTDPDAIRNAITKAGAVPSTCSYEFILRAPGGSVSGWGPGSYRSTEGFSQHSLGTTIGGVTIAGATSFWRKLS